MLPTDLLWLVLRDCIYHSLSQDQDKAISSAACSDGTIGRWFKTKPSSHENIVNLFLVCKKWNYTMNKYFRFATKFKPNGISRSYDYSWCGNSYSYLYGKYYNSWLHNMKLWKAVEDNNLNDNQLKEIPKELKNKKGLEIYE